MSIVNRPRNPDVIDGVHYPSGDGKPMAETPIHAQAMVWLYEAFQDFLEVEWPADYTLMDVFWYWEEGNPRAVTAPDVFVIKGVGRGPRRSFMTWREGGAVPCLAFEMMSRRTWRDNRERKFELYREQGVAEYYMFDPEGEFIAPRLQGFRLSRRRYVPIRRDEDGRLASAQYPLLLAAEGEMVRLIDARTGRRVLTRKERVEQQQARAERLAAQLRKLGVEPEEG